MDENFINKSNTESQIYGISVRGWITLILVLTVCAMAGFKVQVLEPLYTAFSLAIGFYFGQKKN